MFVATTRITNMNGISLLVIGVLLTAASLESNDHAVSQEPKSLEILKRLQDLAYYEDEPVKLVCKVKNAVSYCWYKDGEKIDKKSSSFMLRERKKRQQLLIRKFNKNYAGVYECVGKDEKGNFGKTVATLSLVVETDPLCKRQKMEETKCIPFDESKCPRVTDFAPKAENVKIEVQADYEIKPWPTQGFFIEWNVPKQGRRSIWGWQIIVNGFNFSAGLETCYQVNLKSPERNSKRTILKSTLVPAPLPLTTYNVTVLSLPYTNQSDDGVVAKIVKTFGLCALRNITVCCDSYVKASLARNHSRTSLSWTTHYPPVLNVTIDAFEIRWIGVRFGICKQGFVILDSAQSNYTFSDTIFECGRNYTIQLVVKYPSYAGDVGCYESQPETLFYNPPAPKPLPVQEPQEKPFKGIITAASTIAAILGGIAIVALIYLCKKHKNSNLDEEEALGMEKRKIQDSRIASSSFCQEFPPNEGRLNGTSAWSASINDKNQWIQVDLGKEKAVTAIATQGRKNADQWVTSYVMSYSLNREKFERYQINGEVEVFSGNDDKNTVVTNVLSPPVNARYIRIHPQSWYNHISMRMEFYGRSTLAQHKDNVSVFILNSNHCEMCIEIVQLLAELLMATGRIHCEVDIFVPMQEMCQGLVKWAQEMIFKCDYVIIPWMCEIGEPKKNTCKNMDTLTFLSSVDIIRTETVRNRNKKNKFISVPLDHCPLDIIPPEIFHHNIPSKIDDLVIELLGETRRKPGKILEFDDDRYIKARSKLTQAVNKMKKNHPIFFQKNSETSVKKKKINNNFV